MLTNGWYCQFLEQDLKTRPEDAFAIIPGKHSGCGVAGGGR
jgi:hypothetical protein